MATLLTYYYGIATTEAEALDLAEGFMVAVGREPGQALTALALRQTMEAKGVPTRGHRVSPEALADYVREVEGCVFLFVDKIWQESTYEKGTATVGIVYPSDAYFQFLALFPEVAPILVPGEEIIFKLDTVFVCVGKAGLPQLTPKAIHQLKG